MNDEPHSAFEKITFDPEVFCDLGPLLVEGPKSQPEIPSRRHVGGAALTGYQSNNGLEALA